MPGDSSVSMFTSMNADEFNRGIHRFLKEAKDLAWFNEIPGIVSVFDFFEENNTAYMVMEYLEGCTLREYIRLNGERLDINTGLYMMDSLITALDAVHRAGIIHRDISPENISICNDSTVKLLDFGAAMYRMFTCVMPLESVERIVEDKLPAPDTINHEIPKYLSDVIMKSMEVKTENAHYHSCGYSGYDIISAYVLFWRCIEKWETI